MHQHWRCLQHWRPSRNSKFTPYLAPEGKPQPSFARPSLDQEVIEKLIIFLDHFDMDIEYRPRTNHRETQRFAETVDMANKNIRFRLPSLKKQSLLPLSLDIGHQGNCKSSGSTKWSSFEAQGKRSHVDTYALERKTWRNVPKPDETVAKQLKLVRASALPKYFQHVDAIKAEIEQKFEDHQGTVILVILKERWSMSTPRGTSSKRK